MKRLILAGLLVAVLFPLTCHAAPRVVVSIKPVYSLVAGIMQGVASPELLIKGAASPHGYVLRPSEAGALADADLVIWVGPGLEGFLEKPLSTLASNARQLQLTTELRDQLLPARSGGDWEKDDHEHAKHEHDLDDHHAETELSHFDHHIWLSPVLAQKIVRLASSELSRIDPAHRQQYQLNTEQLLQRLAQLDQRLRARLDPVKTIPYLVFHAAYQYFEKAYGLNAVGSLTIDPERRPGVRRVMEIRDKITRLNARCLFSEPQFESRLLTTLTEGSSVRSGTLDPLGADLPADRDSYFTLLENMAENLYRGLAD